MTVLTHVGAVERIRRYFCEWASLSWLQSHVGRSIFVVLSWSLIVFHLAADAAAACQARG